MQLKSQKLLISNKSKDNHQLSLYNSSLADKKWTIIQEITRMKSKNATIQTSISKHSNNSQSKRQRSSSAKSLFKESKKVLPNQTFIRKKQHSYLQLPANIELKQTQKQENNKLMKSILFKINQENPIRLKLSANNSFIEKSNVKSTQSYQKVLDMKFDIQKQSILSGSVFNLSQLTTKLNGVDDGTKIKQNQSLKFNSQSLYLPKQLITRSIQVQTDTIVQQEPPIQNTLKNLNNKKDNALNNQVTKQTFQNKPNTDLQTNVILPKENPNKYENTNVILPKENQNKYENNKVILPKENQNKYEEQIEVLILDEIPEIKTNQHKKIQKKHDIRPEKQSNYQDNYLPEIILKDPKKIQKKQEGIVKPNKQNHEEDNLISQIKLNKNKKQTKKEETVSEKQSQFNQIPQVVIKHPKKVQTKEKLNQKSTVKKMMEQKQMPRQVPEVKLNEKSIIKKKSSKNQSQSFSQDLEEIKLNAQSNMTHTKKNPVSKPEPKKSQTRKESVDRISQSQKPPIPKKQDNPKTLSKSQIKQQVLKKKQFLDSLIPLGQVAGYCSKLMKKSKLNWHLPALLLYKQIYRHFRTSQDFHNMAYEQKVINKQQLNTFIEQNNILKNNLEKFIKLCQKKQHLKQKYIKFVQPQDNTLLSSYIYQQVITISNQFLKSDEQTDNNISICILRMLRSVCILMKVNGLKKVPKITNIDQLEPNEIQQLIPTLLGIVTEKAKNI